MNVKNQDNRSEGAVVRVQGAEKTYPFFLPERLLKSNILNMYVIVLCKYQRSTVLLEIITALTPGDCYIFYISAIYGEDPADLQPTSAVNTTQLPARQQRAGKDQ